MSADPMTDPRSGGTFADQVRAALRQIVADAHGPTFHRASFAALGQQVAAAIERGAEVAIAPWAAALLPGDLASVREAALRALHDTGGNP